jgi:two-component system, NtrC family, response regulator
MASTSAGTEVAHPITAIDWSVAQEVNVMVTVMPESLKTRHRVLLVESDPNARKAILAALKKSGYAAVEATSSDQAVILLGVNRDSTEVSAILCDIRAQKIKGTEAAAYFHMRYPLIPVIVTAAYPDIEWAITLMKRGAADYLVKPVSKDDLVVVLKNAVHRYVTLTQGSF